MNKALCFLLLLTNIAGGLYAQIMPAENANLQYRIIGFSFPPEENALSYRLEIATGAYTSELIFQTAPTVAYESNENRIVAEVPAFGTFYTWRVITRTINGDKKGEFHHFSIRTNTFSVVNKVRLRVEKQAGAYKKGAYVFVDCTMALYDMNGSVVWVMPDNILSEEGNSTVEDLKCTADGTITFLYHGKLYEITYDGRLLNTVPAATGTLQPSFRTITHHEGTKLKNCHYMALGNDVVSWKQNGSKITIKEGNDNSSEYRTSGFETLNEYDEKGRLVWQYNMADYVLHSDLMNWKLADGNVHTNVHLNAFWFDEANQQFYLGLRDVSRIIKIQYPDGKVLGEFGRKYENGDTTLDQELFNQQHALRISDGYLYLFNNNWGGKNPIPKLTIMKEDPYSDYGVKKVWEYESEAEKIKGNKSRGGNIMNLPDGAVFASYSTPYNDLVIVNKQKKLVWNSKVEKWDTASNSWQGLPTYRASIVPTTKALQDMIWYGR